MKQGTTYQKLGDVCDVINGLWKGKKPPYKNVGVIRNANFTKSFTLRYDNIEYLDVEVRQFEKRKLQKGDLIVERSGGSEKQPVGRAVLFEREDGEFSFSNFTSILRIKDKDSFNSKFLFYFLLFIYKRGDTLGMQKATTGIHNIEFEKYLNISVPAISIAEQERIVERLDAAFAQIDELKSNAEKQLAEARALFQSALTQAMQPKPGWQCLYLEDVCSHIIDCPHTTPKKSPVITNYPCIRTSELKNGRIEWSTMQYLDKAEYEKRISRLEPKPNDIVYGREGTYGDAVILPEGYHFSLGQRTMLLRPNIKIVLPPFLHKQMISSHVYNQAKAKNSGCGVGHVNVKDIKRFILHVPSITEQQIIVEQLDALSNRICELEEISRKTAAECDALKQAVLRQIFE